jgi:glutamate synthase domain-containing protein 1
MKVFVTADFAADREQFDRAIFLLRKQTVVRMGQQGVPCYVVSLSSSTIVYKVDCKSMNNFPSKFLQ